MGMAEGLKEKTGSRVKLGAAVRVGVSVEGVPSARVPDEGNGDCIIAGGLAAVARDL